MTKVLFILRKRSTYGISFGLVNSCKLICESLEKQGISTKISEVVDTFGIDKEIFNFRPDYVILEAIWALPSHLPIIFKLHPYVKKWTVRLHSRSPFLEQEGVAIDYIRQYQLISNTYKNFSISANHTEMVLELSYSLGLKADYLPNIYPFNDYPDRYSRNSSNTINISCFSSIRPKKNILIQAMAAIGFANNKNKILNFHINSDRNELGGENILKNLQNLFNNTKHSLIEHPWSSHSEFCELVCKMDICMGVSNTETYMLTIADAIVNNIPVVSSDVVYIVSPLFHADPNKIESIIGRLEYAWLNRGASEQNKELIKFNNVLGLKAWLEYLNY